MMHTGIDLSRYSYEDLLIIEGVLEHKLEVKEVEGGLVACWKGGGPDRFLEVGVRHVVMRAEDNARRRRARREARS